MPPIIGFMRMATASTGAIVDSMYRRLHTRAARRAVGPTLLAGLVAIAIALPATAVALPRVATPAGYSVTGIDASLYQGAVDWQVVKATGISFAVIRASEQANLPDAKFLTNYTAAKAQGLIAGAYHRAKPDASSGTAQADFFLSQSGYANDGRTLPPTVDMEWPRSGWTSSSGKPLNSCYNMTPAQLVAWTHAFLTEVTARTGRLGIVYTSTSWWKLCTGSDASFGQYPLWVARYSTSPLPLPAGWPSFTFWQYSSSGRLPNGTAVDQDVFNGNSGQLAQLVSGPSGVLTSWVDPKYRHVAYASGVGHVEELYSALSGGSWKHGDLTSASSAPAAAAGSALTSWVDKRYEHLAYLTADGHAHELYFPLTGGTWKHGDLTTASNGPGAATGSALTSWVDSGYQHLAYISSDGHARELYFRLAGGTWKQGDLTTASSAPAAAAGSALTSWVDKRYEHLAYLTADGHAHELYFPLAGGTWKHGDLTTASSAPTAGAGSGLTSWVDSGYQHVGYASSDGHAHELYLRLAGGAWRQLDLTTASGAPRVVVGGELTSSAAPTSQHVAYMTPDGHAHELSRPLAGGAWRQTDVTAASGAPPG